MCINRRRGFTLIELLVVISIIALLISILLPALGAARSSARAVMCLSNQRQAGVGMMTYAADNRDQIALQRHRDGSRYAWIRSWMNALMDSGYVQMSDDQAENVAFAFCTEAGGREQATPGSTGYNNFLRRHVMGANTLGIYDGKAHASDYGPSVDPMIVNVYADGNNATRLANLTAIPAATNFLLIADTRWRGIPEQRLNDYYIGGGGNSNLWSAHGGEGVHGLWADGHANSASRETLDKNVANWVLTAYDE